MSGQRPHLRQAEFIALLGLLIANVAFAIDAMLPALPDIATELSPTDVNRAQLIVTSFVLGMGVGTLFSGPLSDAFGRKPVIAGGVAIYSLGAALAWAAPTLELMLAARLLQGLGAAGPRVAVLALVRDVYGGREMARIMSFVMVVFSIVPALAPTLGHYIILGFGWRALFAAFVLFSLIGMLWLMIRQPETLHPGDRRPLGLAAMLSATQEMYRHHTARLSIIIQSLTFAMLFAVLSSTQQIFDITYGQGENFHLWFGLVAIIGATASLLNARIVMVLGMRAIVRAMFAAFIVVSLLMLAVTLANGPFWLRFGTYILWLVANFFQAVLAIGNIKALAMEDMGHIAGLASSVIAAISTIAAVIIAVPVGLMFNGTAVPLVVAGLILSTISLWLTTRIKPREQA